LIATVFFIQSVLLPYFALKFVRAMAVSFRKQEKHPSKIVLKSRKYGDLQLFTRSDLDKILFSEWSI